MEWPARVAHRCGGVLAPENTLAGLEACAARGGRAVEFDVRLSADGTPVLLHDETLDRTTTGHGPLAQWSDRELAALRTGIGHPRCPDGEPLPTLGVALARCAALGLAANVELKCETAVQASPLVDAVLTVCARAVAPPPVLFSSFSADVLRRLAVCAPKSARGWLLDQLATDWPSRLEAFGCGSVHLGVAGLSQEIVTQVQGRGARVQVWTVDDPELADRLLSWGVEAVISNLPEIFAPAS